MVEYVGIIYIILVLILFIIVVIPSNSATSNLAGSIVCKISTYIGRSGGSDGSKCESEYSQSQSSKENPHEPKNACKKTSSSTKAGAEVGVTKIVSISAEEGVMVEELSDGTFRVTDQSAAGVSAGAGVDAGGEVTIDGKSVGAYAAAGVSDEVKLQGGTTYVVNSEKEKNDLVNYLTRTKAVDATGAAVTRGPSLGWVTNTVIDALDGYTPPPPSEYSVEISNAPKAQARFSGYTLNGHADATLGSTALGMKFNPEEGTTTAYYKISGEESLGAGEALAIGTGEQSASAEGVVAVTMSSDSQKILNVSLSTEYSNKVDVSSLSKLLHDDQEVSKNGGKYEMSLDLNSDDTTRIAMDLLTAHGIPTGNTPYPSPSKQGAAGVDAFKTFVDAARDHGTVTSQEADKKKSEYGAKGSFGFGAGVSLTQEGVTYSNGKWLNENMEWESWEGCE